ncbi:MAG: ankyrin repeat domain-containing protein [Paracoccaceae bacterium]|nr:ankyrin repeat domain-containing protein [Paracoccaceae bacterium]
MITDNQALSQELIEDINQTQDYGAARVALMDAEITLGEIEADSFGAAGHDDRVQSLDHCWDQIASAFEAHLDRLSAENTSLARELKACAKQIEFGLLDNYLHAAVAAAQWTKAQRNSHLRATVFVLSAAMNKYKYAGYGDEVACLRYILARGLPGHAQTKDWDKYTALHLMTDHPVRTLSHPRAVRLLLKHGAQVDARNGRGDTPLILASASRIFTEETYRSMLLLLDAGADPHLQSDDGESAYSILRAARVGHNQQFIERLLAKIDGKIAA